jgi:hypothetical protein
MKRLSQGQSTTRPQQLQSLSQQIFELRERAALQQHVPMGAYRLLDLLRRIATVETTAELARLRVFPFVRHLGLVGHDHREFVPVRAHVDDVLARCHLNTAFVLKTLCPDARSAQ